MSDIDIETEDRQQQLCYKSSLNGSSKNVEMAYDKIILRRRRVEVKVNTTVSALIVMKYTGHS